jgi:hypothetical protein
MDTKVMRLSPGNVLIFKRTTSSVSAAYFMFLRNDTDLPPHPILDSYYLSLVSPVLLVMSDSCLTTWIIILWMTWKSNANLPVVAKLLTTRTHKNYISLLSDQKDCRRLLCRKHCIGCAEYYSEVDIHRHEIVGTRAVGRGAEEQGLVDEGGARHGDRAGSSLLANTAQDGTCGFPLQDCLYLSPPPPPLAPQQGC